MAIAQIFVNIGVSASQILQLPRSGLRNLTRSQPALKSVDQEPCLLFLRHLRAWELVLSKVLLMLLSQRIERKCLIFPALQTGCIVYPSAGLQSFLSLLFINTIWEMQPLCSVQATPICWKLLFMAMLPMPTIFSPLKDQEYLGIHVKVSTKFQTS